MKKQRGITLISLVITIIILIILSGVSINLVLGDNGIITKAKESAKTTKKAAVIEEIKLKILNQQAEGINISKSNLESMLSTYGTIIEENGQIVSVSLEDGTIIEIGEIYPNTIIEDNVTYIYTKEQLEIFRDNVNNGKTYENEVVMLMNDIDLECQENDENTLWNGIGDNNNEFSGTFNGNNYKIYNVSINAFNNSTIYGFFNYILDATIENLIIEGNTKSSLDINVGIAGIVGEASGESTIKKCTNRMNIEKEQATWNAAGIVSNVKKEGSLIIKDSKNEADISGGNNAAGIVGVNYGTVIIEDCYNSGTIESFKGDNVGGLIARDDPSTIGNIIIKNCYNTGKIMGKYICGGAVGVINKTIILDNFYNIGEINQQGTTNSNGYAYVGGCIGILYSRSFGTIINCYNNGKITSQDFVAGGLIGETGAYLKVINSYNCGQVKGKNAASGLVGMISRANSDYTPYIQIQNCLQSGNLISDNYIAGMVKRNTSAIIKVEKSYYLDTTCEIGVQNANSDTEDSSNSISEEYINSQEFVNELNKYVEENPVYQIDSNISIKLSKWKLGENGYPTFE